jgi:hypothetical protein
MTTVTAPRRRSRHDDAGEFELDPSLFPDRGCAFSVRCLECPLRCCIEEMGREERRIVREVWLSHAPRRRGKAAPISGRQN